MTDYYSQIRDPEVRELAAYIAQASRDDQRLADVRGEALHQDGRHHRGVSAPNAPSSRHLGQPGGRTARYHR